MCVFVRMSERGTRILTGLRGCAGFPLGGGKAMELPDDDHGMEGGGKRALVTRSEVNDDGTDFFAICHFGRVAFRDFVPGFVPVIQNVNLGAKLT
jgi:hypothetical protein